MDVAVLGRVELRIDGRMLLLGRAKSAELLVYLALHPAGADADQLWEALWPDRPVSRHLLYTTVSVARQRLREHAGEALEVCDARGARLYQLAAPVSLDWHRFVELAAVVTNGRIAEPVDEVEALTAALDLVRGPPFGAAPSQSYDWARPEQTEMNEAIGAVAERLGNLLLDQGDVLGARRAARRGLHAVPYDERLYRVLLRAAQAANHPDGVEAVLHELADIMKG